MKDTKEHILETAFKLFLSKTFKEVTMKEIVLATGLSKGGFYHYFESKEQLFLEVINDYLLANFVIDYTLFDRQSLSAFYNGYLSFIDNHITGERSQKIFGEEGINSNLYNLIFESVKHFPELKVKFAEKEADELGVWTAVIQQARDQGEIKTEMPNEEIAKMFLYTVTAARIKLILVLDDTKIKDRLASLWDNFYGLLK